MSQKGYPINLLIESYGVIDLSRFAGCSQEDLITYCVMTNVV